MSDTNLFNTGGTGSAVVELGLKKPRPEYILGYRYPYFFTPDTELNARLYNDVDDEKYPGFETREVTGVLRTVRQFTPTLSGSLGYYYSSVNYSALFDANLSELERAFLEFFAAILNIILEDKNLLLV